MLKFTVFELHIWFYFTLVFALIVAKCIKDYDTVLPLKNQACILIRDHRKEIGN